MIQRRLNKLFHGGFLDRPGAQLLLSRNIPMIYALGNAGAQLLCQKLDIDTSVRDWTSKNREAKPMFIEHSLLISKFLICLQLACEKLGVQYYPSEDVVHQKPNRDDRKGYNWSVEVREGGRKHNIALFPDNAFSLIYNRLLDQAQAKVKGLYFFEADRSTMPVKRSNLFRSSFYKKLLGYYATKEQDLYTKTFGVKGVRIITVTTSLERIVNIIKACEDIDVQKKYLRMFLFTTDSMLDLNKPEKLLARVWINGLGEGVSLIE